MAVNFKTKKDIGPRINEQITASEVRLISSSGKQMGILSIREALIQAEDEGFYIIVTLNSYYLLNYIYGLGYVWSPSGNF